MTVEYVDMSCSFISDIHIITKGYKEREGI